MENVVYQRKYQHEYNIGRVGWDGLDMCYRSRRAMQFYLLSENHDGLHGAGCVHIPTNI
jgi:hypothetical protein